MKIREDDAAQVRPLFGKRMKVNVAIGRVYFYQWHGGIERLIESTIVAETILLPDFS